MLKHWPILTNFIISSLLLMIISFSYYMITFYNKYVGGNIYVVTISQTFAEILASFTMMILRAKTSS